MTLVYFLFAQVYPYLHVHVHFEEEKQHVEFTFHPVEDCHIPHEQSNEHQHECNHVHGDWEHTVQKIEVKNTTIDKFILEHRIHYIPTLELCYFDIHTTLDSIHDSHFKALRAPPAIC